MKSLKLTSRKQKVTLWLSTELSFHLFDYRQSSLHRSVKPSSKRLFSLGRACFWSVLPAGIPLPKLPGNLMENDCRTPRDCKWDNTSRSMVMSCRIWIFRAFIPMMVVSTSASLHQRLVLLFFIIFFNKNIYKLNFFIWNYQLLIKKYIIFINIKHILIFSFYQ